MFWMVLYFFNRFPNHHRSFLHLNRHTHDVTLNIKMLKTHNSSTLLRAITDNLYIKFLCFAVLFV